MAETRDSSVSSQLDPGAKKSRRFDLGRGSKVSPTKMLENSRTISSTSIVSNSPAALDFTKLGEEGFDIEYQIRSLLQKLPNEDAVQQLQTQLGDAKDETSKELQRNVFRNYTEFVVISKEISNLEGDIAGILTKMNDLRTARDYFGSFSKVAGAHGDEDNDENQERDPKQDLEVERRQKAMKMLYKELEGLQKVLPVSEHRELLFDGSSASICEIDSHSFKPKEQVNIHVANDYLIICVAKKSMLTGKSKSVEKTYPISDIGFIDMKDTIDLSNAFKMMIRGETYIYRSETLQEKKSLLDVISKVTAEFLKVKKTEIEKKNNSFKEIRPDSTTPIKNEITNAAPKKAVSDGLSNSDYAWMVEVPDELDVLIAQREFGHAISMIERAHLIISATTGETPRLQILRQSLEERTLNVARLIANGLTSPGATKEELQDDIHRLLRLGLGEQARDIYLSNRTSNIKHRLRQLQFNGDIVSFMHDYSDMFFSLLKSTCEWFGGSFEDPGMASGFMKWINDQIAYFAQNFRKQVFEMNFEFSVISECIITATDKCQDMNEVGMDLTFTFEKLIEDDLMESIKIHAKSCDAEILAAFQKDTFDKTCGGKDTFEFNGVSAEIPALSDSALQLFITLSKFGSEVGALLSLSLYNEVIPALGNFFKIYVNELQTKVQLNLEIIEVVYD